MARVVYNEFEGVIWIITKDIVFHYVLEDPFVTLVGRRELIFIEHYVGLASVTSDCLFQPLAELVEWRTAESEVPGLDSNL